MAYATKTDIEDIFGVDNVRQWSNLENDVPDPDTARIARAIAWADRYLDNRFRGSRFTVPLTPDTDFVAALPEITDLAARLAGHWLYVSRTMRPEADDTWPDDVLAWVNNMIDLYLLGRIVLPAMATVATSGALAIRAPEVVTSAQCPC